MNGKQEIERCGKYIEYFENRIEALKAVDGTDVGICKVCGEIEATAQGLCDSCRDRLTIRRIKRSKDGVLCCFCGEKPVYARNLCKNCYSRWRLHGTPDYVQERLSKIVKQAPEIPWRVLLCNDVVGSLDKTPEDFDESVDSAIATLSPREERVILGRYRGKKTLAEIGGEEGVSKERVRQIQERALRKLRHPSRKMCFEIGNNGIAQKREKDLQEAQNLKRAAESEKRERLRRALDESGNIKIEELELSARAFYVLKKAGINTMQDLLSLSREGLLSLRNCGRKTAEEICEKAKRFGF